MRPMTLNLWVLTVTAAVLAMVTVALFRPILPAYGSTSRGSEYQSTTTASGFTTDIQLQSTTGTFGSVVITGAGTASMTFYDATTSNITKRATSMSTTSITRAFFPASAAAATYTFDSNLVNGLYMNIGVGTIPSTTVTFRQ